LRLMKVGVPDRQTAVPDRLPDRKWVSRTAIPDRLDRATLTVRQKCIHFVEIVVST